jgi:hypothetical protein
VGVEFKYTEPEFGCCGGFASRGASEAERWACVHDVDARKDGCYLLSKERRRYLEPVERQQHFRIDPLATGEPCLLLGPANQLFRSHVMTRALARAMDYDGYGFLALYDGRNEVLFQPERRLPGLPQFRESAYERYCASLEPAVAQTIGRASIQELCQSLLLGLGHVPAWARELDRRYGWVTNRAVTR